MNELVKIQSRFLWGDGELKKKLHLVSWNKVARSKERGGLGIKNLRRMNECLLMKWWWRFGVEKNALWRQVLCNKYNIDALSWSPPIDLNRGVSIVWRDILMVGQGDSNLVEFYLSNIRISVGDGRVTRFWSDFWIGESSLQSLFPRVFGICTEKSITVAEALQGGVNGLRVRLNFRRRVFSWEQDEWNNFMELMSSTTLHQGRSDTLRWVANQSLAFSVNSMYKCIEADVERLRIDLLPLWKNHAPPKVQFFGWLAVLGRIKTAKLLFSLGIFSDFNDSLCHFCGAASESVEHLFLHCKVVWPIWCRVLRWWKIAWVIPGTVKSLFVWWQSWKFRKIKKELWELSFFAVLWSIWKVRNDLIFRGAVPKWEDMGDIIKHRISHWFKAAHGSKNVSSNDILFSFPALIDSL